MKMKVMYVRQTSRWLLASTLLTSCSSSDEQKAAPSARTGEKVSFGQDIQPIVDKCTECHSSGKTKPDLSNVDQVKIHADTMLRRMSNGTMPPSGKLPSQQIDSFQSWIAQGKPET